MTLRLVENRSTNVVPLKKRGAEASGPGEAPGPALYQLPVSIDDLEVLIAAVLHRRALLGTRAPEAENILMAKMKFAVRHAGFLDGAA